jgi:hypothetical protein
VKRGEEGNQEELLRTLIRHHDARLCGRAHRRRGPTPVEHPGRGQRAQRQVVAPAHHQVPGFLGLDKDFGIWPDTDFGDGVIIGFVDSGI